MQTYSHVIITIACKRMLNKAKWIDTNHSFPALHSKAFLIGSFLPDLPLTLIAVYTILHDWIGNEEKTSLTSWLFKEGFFENQWIKTAHNLFHAPIPLLSYLGIGLLLWKRGKTKPGQFIVWLAIACLIHTLIDIPLHHDDGPLLWFPFNFETRFYSPVSYWDPNHFGGPAAVAEHALVVGLALWLVFSAKKNALPQRL